MKDNLITFGICLFLFILSCNANKYNNCENSKWSGTYGDNWKLSLYIDNVNDSTFSGEMHKSDNKITYFEGRFFENDSILFIEKEHVYRSDDLQLGWECPGKIIGDTLKGVMVHKFNKETFSYNLIIDKDFKAKSKNEQIISKVFQTRKQVDNSFRKLIQSKKSSKDDYSKNEDSFINLFLEEYAKINNDIQSTNDSAIVDYFKDECYYDSVYYMISLEEENESKSKGIEIPLTTRTNLDFRGKVNLTPNFNFVYPLFKEPKEKLILPDIDSASKYYLALQTGFGDNTCSILVIPKEDSQILYVDSNDDEDLTNDGEPQYFSNEQSSINFIIFSNEDPNQKLSVVLKRNLDHNFEDPNELASFQKESFDEDGNMKPIVPLFHEIRSYLPDFDGNKERFYFNDVKNFTRGEFTLNGLNYQIGLYDDFPNDGLFNGRDDLLFIDLNRDGIMNKEQDTEIFKLNEVFMISDEQFKISCLDPYGGSIKLIQTNEATTNHYLEQIPLFISGQSSPKNGIAHKLNPQFWEYTFQTIDGNEIKIDEYKGKYLLVNFWGEWCKPCVAEIPSLVKAFEKYPENKFEMISFLNSTEQRKAKEIIKGKGMKWPQIKLTKELVEFFKIRAYPTNILIFPDGVTTIRANAVDEKFFEKHIN